MAEIPNFVNAVQTLLSRKKALSSIDQGVPDVAMLPFTHYDARITTLMRFDMEFDAIDTADTTKYDFSGIRDGLSLWVPNHAERVSTMTAFARWKERTGSRFSATSSRVGAKDPRGEGIRIFFKADAPALRPIVLAKLPKIDNLDEIQTNRMLYTGIETNEDIIAAVLSTGTTPGTVTEAIVARRLVFAGKTPLQIERMAEMGHPSFEERQQNYHRSEAERLRKANDWPDDDGRSVSPGYLELTDDQRREMRAEAMIENEDEYLKAMRSRPVDEAQERSLGAVIGGYSDFTTWKVRQKARMGGGEEN